MNLTVLITPDEFEDLRRGQTKTIAAPLANLSVQVCAQGTGYARVDFSAIQVATDLRKGKCLFLNLKMQNQIQSVPAETVAEAV